MEDGRSRDASNHDVVYRTVGGLNEKSIIYEHAVLTVTPTTVYVDQSPRDQKVLGFYETRQGGTHALDRNELEATGRYPVEYGPTEVCFYLERSDVQEEVETPAAANEGARVPELRPIPVDALESEVVSNFEQLTSRIEPRYDDGFSERLLFEIALRQSLVDFQAHGKDSPLIQQLDSIVMTDNDPDGSALRPVPVDRIHVDLLKNLDKTLGALNARYKDGFAERRLLEVALRQMFTDVLMYQERATPLQWLDILLSE